MIWFVVFVDCLFGLTLQLNVGYWHLLLFRLGDVFRLERYTIHRRAYLMNGFMYMHMCVRVLNDVSRKTKLLRTMSTCRGDT